MQINRLTNQQAIEWFKFGWTLFTKQPVQWIFIFLIVFGLAIVLNIIPLGGLVFMVLTPAIFAGIFTAVAAAENNQAIPFSVIFSVLQDSERRNPFLILGGLNFLFNLFLAFVIIALIGGTVGLSGLMTGGDAAIAAFMGAGLWMLMVVLPLLLIYLMALLYAVPLILFKQVGIKEALLWSLKAGFSNVVPMMVAGIIYFILAFISSLLFGLGFIILIPVSFIAVYASYKDLFGTPDTLQNTRGVIEA